MAKNNPVTRILVTSGNLAPLAAGSAPSALGVGQIGFFSYDSNLSVDGSVAGLRNFYLAVGVDRDGDGTVDDIVKSAGSHIQKVHVTNVNMRCYTPGQPKIVDITGFTAKCDTDYGINVNVANGEAYANYGFNTPMKSYFVHSLCCTDDCQACPGGNGNDVALQLVNNINADPDKVISAQLLDYTTTPGTPVVVAISGYAAWVTAHGADNTLGIRITSTPEGLKSYLSVNLKYDFVRGTNINVNLVEGFNCTGTVTVTQNMAYEEGAGYDLQWEEYYNAGYAGSGNYRQSSLLGQNFDNWDVFALKSGKYLTYALTYDQESVGGWEEYKNNLLTIVAIPCADTTTRAGFFTMQDAILSQFEPLSNDAAACADCTTVNFTSARAATVDGIVDAQGD